MIPQHAAAMFRLGLIDDDRDFRRAGISLPSEADAVRTVLMIYLQQIVDGTMSPHEGMLKIDRDLNTRVDSGGARTYPNPVRKPDRSVKKRFVGEELGAEYLYTWWRELCDVGGGGDLIYYTDLPPDQALQKFEQHIVDEAERLLARLMDGGPRR